MLNLFRRWRWTLGTVIGICIVSFVAYEKHSAAEEYKHHREIYCAAFSSAEDQKMACIEESASSNDYLPWWYILVSWPDGITVWALIGTGIAIVWQSSIARKSAIASRLSADALINSQRAWIMADLRFQAGAGKITYTDNPTTRGQDTNVHLELTLINCGPSPAWVVEQWARLEFSYEILASKTNHEYPELPYGKGVQGSDRAGKFSCANYLTIPLVKDSLSTVWTFSLRENGVAFPENLMHAYVYGVVMYRDAFSSARETYFGYLLKGGELSPIPSDAYNRHT